MSRLRLWLFILTVLSATLPRIAQAISAENRHFQSALDNLRAGLFERAEREFAQFTRQFPDSARLPEAILCQAEARLRQTNYDGAIELLTAHGHQAGQWADAYLFWLGESYSGKGDYGRAAEEFAKLTKEFPASSRLLEASVREATARSRLKPPDWPRVIELLQQTNEVFQAAARTNAASEWVPRGCLLLGEAFMAQTNYHAAEATLLPLGNRLMNPATAWQWQYLICRAQLADGRAEAALLSTSNLLMFARSAEQPSLQAQSAAFKGSVLERLGRFDQAMDAYQTNLAPSTPAEFQRQALFRITELSLAQNKIADATKMLEKFLTQYPQAAAADLAWLTLGELRLRQFAAMATNKSPGTVTNGIAATNFLSNAHSAFETLTQQFPKSPHFGLAQLNLGWCLWLEGNILESRNAFQDAVTRLPLSADLARAHFKLGDAEFRLRDFAGAIANYSAITQKFTSFPEVETTFFEPALYQIVQAGVAAGNLPAATNALQKILAWYPNGFHTDRAVLLTGQELARQGNPARAREVLSAFVNSATNAPLAPEVRLAIARAYEQENDWTNAIQQYEDWLGNFTNHPARPRAEYCRALAYFHAGDETNALNLFTNFVAQFPTNEFAPSAQQWVAYYYYNASDFNRAESDFQLLYRRWPTSELACQARLMAGLAAFMRQSWEDAKRYFVELYNPTNNCPAEVRLQALFAYGDYWLSRDPTNTAADSLEAIQIFSQIAKENPTNQIGLDALGRKADALLQAGQFDEAAKAYQQLTNSSFANIATRCGALIGLALVLEKQAEQKDLSARRELLTLALDCCLDVLFPEKIMRDGEQADPFWTKKAGVEAIHLAEALGDWRHVISISQKLCGLLPVLCPFSETKILKAQENIRAQN